MRGYFGVGIYHPKFECNQGTLWRSAAAFGASFVFTVGQRFRKQASDTSKSHLHLPAFQFATLGDLLAHLPYSCPLVGVELDGRSTPLDSFAHPDRACYLLGAEDHGLPPGVLGECHHVVQIPGARQCLNVATAGAITLYARSVQRARGKGSRQPVGV